MNHKTITILFIFLLSGLVLSTLEAQYLQYSQVASDYAMYTSLDKALKEPKKVHKLDLSGQDLKMLPAKFTELQQLEYLSLSDNPNMEWDAVMNILYKFPNLAEIDLSYNNLSFLPVGLENVGALRLLNLDGNRLSNLPSDWEGLQEMQVIGLEDNQFTSVPRLLENYMQLKLVNFKGNPMEIITKEEKEEWEKELKDRGAMIQWPKPKTKKEKRKDKKNK